MRTFFRRDVVELEIVLLDEVAHVVILDIDLFRTAVEDQILARPILA